MGGVIRFKVDITQLPAQLPTQLPDKPRIAVIGAGAVGCYYGGKLAAAGHDVRFLMRADLETVRAQGLTLRSVGETEVRFPVTACATPEEIGPVDLVIIALKATSNAALETLLPPLLHETTALVTLQNGLGNEAFLAERFGAGRVMGALCFVCLNRVAPGVIEHYGHGKISIGEYQGGPLPRTRALVAALRAAGIDANAVDDLANERWRKLVWNIPFNGLAIAAGGVTTDVILGDPGLLRLARGLMRETIAAAAGDGQAIPAEYADFQIERTWAMGPYRPSSLIDFQGGRPVEVEPIWGEPYRRAQAAGVETGRLEALYFLLRKLAAHEAR